MQFHLRIFYSKVSPMGYQIYWSNILLLTIISIWLLVFLQPVQLQHNDFKYTTYVHGMNRLESEWEENRTEMDGYGGACDYISYFRLRFFSRPILVEIEFNIIFVYTKLN